MRHAGFMAGGSTTKRTKSGSRPASAVTAAAIEAELARCAEAGELADFTAAKWRGRSQAKPKISAAFLSRLWLGLEDVRVHPRGLAIKGLEIVGQISLGGARVDARMRSPLMGFSAEHCDFPDGISLQNSRVEALYFIDCIMGEGVGPEDSPHAFSASSAEIVGQVYFGRVKINGSVSFSNAVIDDDLQLNQIECASALFAMGMEVRGSVSVTHSTFGMAEQTVNLYGGSIVMDGAAVADRVHFESLRCPAGISLGRLSANVVVIIRCRIGTRDNPGALVLANCTTAHLMKLDRVRVHGWINAAGISVGQSLMIHRCYIGRKSVDQPSIFAPMMRIGTGIDMTKTRLYGHMMLESSVIGDVAKFSHIDLSLINSNIVAFSANAIKARQLHIDTMHCGGQISFKYAELDSVTIANCWINNIKASKRLLETEAEEAKAAFGLSFEWARINRGLLIHKSIMAGGIHAQCVEIGGQMTIGASWLGGSMDQYSLYASSAKIGDILTFERMVAPSAVMMPLLKCSELQVRGNSFGCSADPDAQIECLWMSEAVIERSISIGRSVFAAGDSVANLFAGIVDFSNVQVGQSVEISSARFVRTRQWPNENGGGALTFAGARIERDLVFWGAKTKAGEALDPDKDTPPELTGALILDGASLSRFHMTRGVSITAIGGVQEPTGDSESADRVRRRKRGVALSLIGTEVKRDFRLEEATLSGIVDLRDANLGELADGGGARWQKAKVKPGHLLLDGLTYRDLDDDEDVASDDEAGTQGSHSQPKGVVQRRLAWLAMQYPGGEATSASFTPQPYEQLAKHYAQMGDERARRQIHVARRNLQRQHSGLGAVEKWAAGLLNFVGRYGYSPGRASTITALFLLLGGLLAWQLNWAGAIVPADAASPSATPFSPFLYAIDLAVPVLDLGLDDQWAVDSGKLSPFFGRDTVISFALALYRLLGLVLVSITVLTFSGILREKD